ncbi:leucine dehydrogenase-like [Saccoglossus kowalevskii]|uniref:Glutamate dehydrogenase A-like n=1 Tax=Saccoglossus kowalevskii TaxID=10224 RepID=A0ABM0MU00_SACKO|nr:PREDICTED: glutamate dehydrogenase A-like [Saccoglossus kowalevskii]
MATICLRYYTRVIRNASFGYGVNVQTIKARIPFSVRRFSAVATLGHRYHGVTVRSRRPEERALWHDRLSRDRNLLRLQHTARYSSQSDMLEWSPHNFADFLRENDIQRCYMVWDRTDCKVKVSHPELEPIEKYFAKDKIDYDQHEGVFLQLGQRTGCLLGAFIWRTNRGQACGGVRLWNYTTIEQYLRDGLRLGQGMGVKSALAGLWAGGGKGVVQVPMANKHFIQDYRTQIFYDYGDFLSSLNGCYVTAEDVGVNVHDLDHVHQHTRYTTCIPEEKGGSGNPSIATGKGVVCAMEGALGFLHMGSLEGKSVAIQGAGNVATVIVDELIKKRVAQIYVTDCHQFRVDDMRDLFRHKHGSTELEIKKVPIDDTSIMSRQCHILSPCALGNILNKDTIPLINADIVCGAANNQLGSPEDNELLKERGITYVVDYLANRMGIVNCANETYGRLPNDPAITRHFDTHWENSIINMTTKILEKARDDDITPVEAANAIADKMSRVLHPIWPNRSQQIIDALVETEWHKQPTH